MPQDDVTAWVRRFLTSPLQPLPLYGSWEWLQADQVTRVASCVRAAECWRDHRSIERVQADLRRQLLEDDERVLQRMKGAAVDVAEGADWTAIAARPTYAELHARRQVSR